MAKEGAMAFGDDDGRLSAKIGMCLFGESDSHEYRWMAFQVSRVMAYVSRALRAHTRAEAERRLQKLMPHPIKSLESLDLLCSPIDERYLALKNLVSGFSRLGALEKELAASSSKYPVLHTFLAQRHLVARHFLMAPMLASKAAGELGRWKLDKGFGKHQSWVFLEHSEQDARELIPRLLPRASESRSTAELARLMDGIERLADALVSSIDHPFTMEELKSCGIYREEWASDDDPLVSAALELIHSKVPILQPSDALKFCLYNREGQQYVFDADYSIDDEERCMEMFKPLLEPHPPGQFSIRLVAMKLLQHYVESGMLLQPIKLFQTREGLKRMHEMLSYAADLIGVRVHKVMCSHIEDLLEDAVELLEAPEMCECCKPSFKAIVECSRAYSAPLAKTRLPMLAREVLRSWKKPEFNRPWTETAKPPFPAPILEEIETYAARDLKMGRRMTWSPPASLEHVVRQFRKARSHGIAEHHSRYEDPVLRTSVEVLEMAEAQFVVEGVLRTQATEQCDRAAEEEPEIESSTAELGRAPEMEIQVVKTVEEAEIEELEVEQTSSAEQKLTKAANELFSAWPLDKLSIDTRELLLLHSLEMGLLKLPPMATRASGAGHDGHDDHRRITTGVTIGEHRSSGLLGALRGWWSKGQRAATAF